MTHVLAGSPCNALYNNLEVDNGGLAVLLLYLDMLQEAKGANAARHSVGEAFELTLRDEIAAYKSYMEALEQVLRTRPLVFIRPRLLVRALACWSGQIANQQTSKLALQCHPHTCGCDIDSAVCQVADGAFPESEFPLPLDTKDLFEPWMPATAMERWGFVVIAYCTPSHRKVAERLKRSLDEFGLPHSIQVLAFWRHRLTKR